MGLKLDLPVIPVLIAVALLVYVLLRMWRSRRERVAPWLIATIVILLAWALGLTQELSNPHLEGKLFWANLEFVPIMALPIVWLLTLRRIVERRAPRRWWQVAGWAVTALLMTMVFVNPQHLYRLHPSLVTVNGESALNYDYGPLFYFGFVPWAAGLLVAAATLLIRGMSQTPLVFRRRNVVLLLASVVPMAGLAIYLSKTLPWQSFDPTFLCVSIAVLMCGYAVLRYHVLDVAPLARNAVIEYLADGVVVIDANDSVIDFNAAARRICPGLDRRVIGRQISEAIPDQPAISHAVHRAHDVSERETTRLAAPARTDEQTAESPRADAFSESDEISLGEVTLVVNLAEDGQGAQRVRHLAVSVSPMQDRDGGRLGSVIIFHDVTRRVQLYEEAQLHAATDDLTALLVRRHFRRLADRELSRAACHNLSLSLLAIDLDDFKTVNDSFGHQAGDQVLRSVASACREQLRDIDLMARFGGDEFCVLLPQADEPQALQVAERLREAIGARQHWSDGRAFSLTASVGIATIDVVDAQGLNEMIGAADAGLYEAKRRGKDRVAVGPPVKRG
jgi:diguanylate cyclase (GGDEF)-like protein